MEIQSKCIQCTLYDVQMYSSRTFSRAFDKQWCVFRDHFYVAVLISISRPTTRQYFCLKEERISFFSNF